jgi:hypothetical protein
LLKVILHQFWVKKIFPWKFIWNTVVPLLSYSCMFQVVLQIALSVQNISIKHINIKINVYFWQPGFKKGDNWNANQTPSFIFSWSAIIAPKLFFTRYNDRQSSEQNINHENSPQLQLQLKVILHQFWVKKIFPWKFIWNTVVPLLSYSCMFQVEICSQQLEICKSVCMFFLIRGDKPLTFPMKGFKKIITVLLLV